MAITTRTEFKEYILRRCGKPVLEINVADEQIEDRIDDAFEFFYLHHYDATQKQFVKHIITQGDIDNEYIVVADPIQDVIKVYQNRAGAFSSGIFNEEFQLYLHNIETLTGGGALLPSSDFGLIDFTITSSYLSLINETVLAEKSFLFNKTINKLFILHNWSVEFQVDEVIVMEVWSRVDAVTNPELYNDKFLKEYAYALVKKQWGENLKKYGGITLAGGVTIEGSQIYQEADELITRLEETMIATWSVPPLDLIG